MVKSFITLHLLCHLMSCKATMLLHTTKVTFPDSLNLSVNWPLLPQLEHHHRLKHHNWMIYHCWLEHFNIIVGWNIIIGRNTRTSSLAGTLEHYHWLEHHLGRNIIGWNTGTSLLAGTPLLAGTSTLTDIWLEHWNWWHVKNTCKAYCWQCFLQD